MNDRIIPFGEILEKTFSRIQAEDARQALTLSSGWKKILCRIRAVNPNEGRNMAAHSDVVDLKNGVLLVEADHPGWISLVQLHKKYILNGLCMAFPRLGIKSLAMRLKGADKGLSDVGISSEQISRRAMEENFEAEEDANRIAGICDMNLKPYGEIPSVLKDALNSLRMSMEMERQNS